MGQNHPNSEESEVVTFLSRDYCHHASHHARVQEQNPCALDHLWTCSSQATIALHVLIPLIPVRNSLVIVRFPATEDAKESRRGRTRGKTLLQEVFPVVFPLELLLAVGAISVKTGISTKEGRSLVVLGVEMSMAGGPRPLGG
jgi:hypothetical protein